MLLNDDMEYIIKQMIEADGIIYMPVMHACGTNSCFQAFWSDLVMGIFVQWEDH